MTQANRVDDEELVRTSLRVREHILRMSARGGAFVGASLSCADVLVQLYARTLRITPSSTESPHRDYFLLSKGHAVPALYGVLAEYGFMDAQRLDRHLSTEDCIYWHPNPSIRGVEFHSGSLGHALSVGLGIALDIDLRGGSGKVFVMVGDGELNEGSCWEVLLTAPALGITNLVPIIDRNHLQANVPTEELVPLEPLADKLAAFGWNARTVDGHSFSALDSAFSELPYGDSPSVVIADTVRGKGVPSIERRTDCWFLKPDAERTEALLTELRADALGGEK